MKNCIKIERAKLDMTQQDLADAVKVSRQTINSIESSRFVPSAVLAMRISNVFNKTVNEIFELEEGD